MRWIIQSSLNFRLLVVAVAATAMFLGIRQLPNLPVNVLPEFSPVYVEVQTEALGLSAEEVEQLITVPLEADLLNGVAWLKSINSSSIPGLSSILMTFQPGTNILRARQMVQERLTQAHGLPNVSKPPAMMQPLSSTSRVMNIGLTAKGITSIDMSVLARWTIRPRLLGVNGVANVAMWGQRKRQLQVQVDPEKLKEKGVTLNQVIKTAGEALWVSPLTFLKASTPGTGGWIDTPNQRLGIRHLQPIRTPAQLAKVAVEGKELVLEDIANVKENHQLLIGDAVVNDGPGLMLVVEKFPWANTLDVTRNVEKALNLMRPGLTGMQIDSTLFRPATYVETSVSNLTQVLPIGGLLAALFIFLCFFNWRLALISLAAILASLFAAALVLYWRGTAVDTMILTGLVVGLAVIIDDAIADTQNIARRLSERRTGDADKSMLQIIFEASFQSRSVMVYSTIMILLIVTPLFFIKGLSGAFLQPLAMSYILAILASMLVALTVTPALSAMLLRRDSLQDVKSPLAISLGGFYDTIVSWCVRTPLAAYGATAIIFFAGIIAWPQLGQQSLVPSFKENDVLVEWEGQPGTSRQAMNRILAKASRELRSVASVRNVSANVGRAVLSDRLANVNSSELWVSVNTGADYDTTIVNIQKILDGYPGFNTDVTTYLKAKTREAVTGEDDAIVVRLFGHDLNILREKAEEVRMTLAKINGVVGARVEQQYQTPTLEIKPNLERANEHGIKPGDIRRAATTLLSGIEVGSLFEEQKVFDVVVWGAPETRHSLTSVSNLVIDTPKGGHVKLKDVADLRIVPAVNVIERAGVGRRIDITANVRGRALGSVSADVERAIGQIKFPLEYHAEVLGEYQERQAAQRRVGWYVLAAVAGIFLLMQVTMGSWWMAAVVLITLPIALVGGVLAAFTIGGMASLGTLVGLLAIFAIALRNNVALVNHLQHLEHQEGMSFGPNLILRAVRERFMPVLMTAGVIALVLVPILFVGSIPGHEILYPMAIVIVGGLVTTLLLSLFILPALYVFFGSGSKPDTYMAELKMGAN